ncbi:hypothetical protein ABIA22_004732 [Sinorhizobium fredii]
MEVDFGPNEKQYKRYELLGPIADEVQIFDLLEAGSFGGRLMPFTCKRNASFEAANAHACGLGGAP